MRQGFHNRMNNSNEFHLPAVFLLFGFLLMCPPEVFGQCVNPPTVTLSSSSGNTCGITPVTVAGNSFGGSATKVTITENGEGSVIPTSSTISPFTFTYTPKNKDLGKKITIKITTNNLRESNCPVAVATYILTVNANPSAPKVGTITQAICDLANGSVVLNGLPPTGTWKLTRSPDAVTVTGTGTSTKISGLAAGTYNFTITDAAGCVSVASANVIIKVQSSPPATPVVGTITQPSCTQSTGSVLLSGLPSTGTWTLIRYPGTVTTEGTGLSVTVSGLASGTYNFAVTNSYGCISALSANVILATQSTAPTAPLVGIITQPTSELPSGSVILNGLPESGPWTITQSPGNNIISGTGTSITISGLTTGTYSFIVTNSSGCTSIPSASVVINSVPDALLLVVTDPAPVCIPSTVDLTAPEVTAGSALNLTYTYWIDPTATIPFITPYSATAGTYYIKGTAISGTFAIKPVMVVIDRMPLADAGADQVQEFKFETILNAELPQDNETGLWTVLSGSGVLADVSYAKSSVDNLSIGENSFIWSVTNGVCPSSNDTVNVTVHNLTIPTLITPNMDGKNDYFTIPGLNMAGKVELVIFDRRGAQVYSSEYYDNKWNGIDYSGDQLSDDTYFYVLRTEKGKPVKGYIVIRR